LWWYINMITEILDIIHHPVSLFKNRMIDVQKVNNCNNLVPCGMKQFSFLSCRTVYIFLSSRTTSVALRLVFCLNVVSLNKLSCPKTNSNYSSIRGSSENFLIMNGHFSWELQKLFRPSNVWSVQSIVGRSDRNLVLPCCKTLLYSKPTKS
jgi:hypothetical protein